MVARPVVLMGKPNDGVAEVLEPLGQLEVAIVPVGVKMDRTVDIDHSVMPCVHEIGSRASLGDQLLGAGRQPVFARFEKAKPGSLQL